jgi:hypothetical protein
VARPETGVRDLRVTTGTEAIDRTAEIARIGVTVEIAVTGATDRRARR